MDIQLEFNKQDKRLILDGEMTIYSAAELKPKLLSVALNPDILDIDLSQVRELDVAGLQLMLLIKRESEAKGSPLRFVSHSAAIHDVLQLCNLEALFDLSSEAIVEAS